MEPLSFTCDYNEGAHPLILQKLLETNMKQEPGYGEDSFSASAREKIRAAIGRPKADVFFLVGGTQTNATVIDALLHGSEGVIAAATGHIAVHEAGAVEFCGHKVITLPQREGRLAPETLEAYMKGFYGDPTWPHMVSPGMVYVSFPTEYGTIYTKAELEEIHSIAAAFGLPLFIDGARLGYGLMSPACDVTLPELARLCEVFYIGGTKVGCFCGEAVVFPKGNAPAHFYTIFSRHAIDMAMKLKDMLREKGCRFFIDSPTNQQFVVLENSKLKELSEHVAFDLWDRIDPDHTAVRFATSWATPAEHVEILRQML